MPFARIARSRATFFGRVQVLFYAAAGLSQNVADELQEIAVETCGERLVLVTGLGSTETAPMAICRPWASELSSAIGLPVPGVEVKLVRSAGLGEDAKLEIRVRGPNVTPGYWRQDALTREAFDDEGYYCMGDAARPVDRGDLSKGLVFDGRIKEDFKLSTGTWVSVGPLRAQGHHALCAICARRGDRRARSRRGRRADRAGRGGVPDALSGSPSCRDGVSRSRPSGVRERSARAADDLYCRRHGQCDEARSGHRARRTAVARRR